MMIGARAWRWVGMDRSVGRPVSFFLAPAFEQILKRTCIKLVREHKKKCDDPYCEISTIALLILLNNCGIPLTKEEQLGFA
jgi:hypothetical protein